MSAMRLEHQPELHTCPTLDRNGRLTFENDSTLAALRHLRRYLDGCMDCPLVDGCPALENFNRTVRAAVEQVGMEI